MPGFQTFGFYPAPRIAEAGLGVRPGESAGTAEAASPPVDSNFSEYVDNRIFWTSTTPIQTIKINDVVVTGVGQTFVTSLGILTVTGIDAKGLDYQYRATDNAGAGGSDSFVINITEQNGTSATKTQLIHFTDDTPLLFNEIDPVLNVTSATSSGNLLANDYAGADGLAKLEVKGTGAYSNATISAATVSGTYGTLLLNPDGTYTYTLTTGTPPATASDVFTYQVTDGDGSVRTASLTLSISSDPNLPTTTDFVVRVDETSLPGATPGLATGPTTVSGTMPISFGPDGAGTIELKHPTYGDSWTQDGLDMAWNPGTSTLTATSPSSGLVYSIVVNPTTGEYTATLHGPYQHAQSSSEATLLLWYTITDSNGSSAADRFRFLIGDDEPGFASPQTLQVANTAGAGDTDAFNGAANAGVDGLQNAAFVMWGGIDYVNVNGKAVLDSAGRQVYYNGSPLKFFSTPAGTGTGSTTDQWYNPTGVLEARTASGFVVFTLQVDPGTDNWQVELNDSLPQFAFDGDPTGSVFGSATMKGRDNGHYDLLITSRPDQNVPTGTFTYTAGEGTLIRHDFVRDVINNGTNDPTPGEYYDVLRYTTQVSVTSGKANFYVTAYDAAGESQPDGTFHGDTDDIALVPDATVGDGSFFYLEFLEFGGPSGQGRTMTPQEMTAAGITVTAVDRDNDGTLDSWLVQGVSATRPAAFRIVSSDGFNAFEVEAASGTAAFTMSRSTYAVAGEASAGGISVPGVSGPISIPVEVMVVDGDGDKPLAGPPSTATIVFEAPDGQPVVTPSAGSSAYIEGVGDAIAPPVAIDPGLTISDSDDTALASATVTILNFVSGQDALGFVNDGSTMGDIAILSNAGNELKLTSSSGTATVAEWQAALRAVTYVNSSDAPTTTARTVEFIVSDGTLISYEVTKTVTVTNVSDAPSGTDKTLTMVAGTNLTLTTADFGFSDVENNTFTFVRIATLPEGGILFRDADGLAGPTAGTPVTVGQAISVSDINAGRLVILAPSESDSFTFQVQDNGNTSNGGQFRDASPNIMTINVTPAPGAPEGTDATKVIGEGDTYTFLVADFGFTDPSNDPDDAFVQVKITTLPASGTLYLDATGGDPTDAVAVTAGQFVSTADIADGKLFFVAAPGMSGIAQFTFQVQDDGTGGQLDTSPNTFTFTIAPTDIAVSTAEVSEISVGNLPVALLSVPGTAGTAVTYEILSDSSGGAFAVEGDKLVVVDNSKLDYETATTVAVEIRVTNEAGQTYDETLTLDVIDAVVEPRYAAHDEQLVNTTTANPQRDASVAALSDGYVVTWTHYNSAMSMTGADIRAQRYDTQGQMVGSEILVNTVTDGTQAYSQVFKLGTGFIVVWEDDSGVGGDADDRGIKAQRFDANGVKVGDEILVNTSTHADQIRPDVIELADGGFAITWALDILFADTHSDLWGDVFVQVYEPNGDLRSSEILVNTQTDGGQSIPKIAALEGGGFVVTWISEVGGDGSSGIEFVVGTDGSGGPTGTTPSEGASLDIRAQIYTANGVKVGNEFFVNTTAAGNQTTPTVTGLSNGNFVVAWTDGGATLAYPTDSSIRAQIFTATGAAVGTEFLVNTTTAGNQMHPVVTTLPGGGFIVSWTDYSASGFDNSGQSIRAQMFDASGQKIGSEFVMNEDISGNQSVPSIAVGGSGDLIAAWTNSDVASGDGSGSSIAMRLLELTADPNLAPVVDLNGGDAGIDYAAAYTEGGAAAAVADASVEVTDADGTDFAGATVTITDALAGDVLTLSGALPTGITVDSSSTATMLVLTGTATAADYQTALALVRYSSTSDNPTAAGSDMARTITTTVNDGISDSAPATTTVTITAVNDPPEVDLNGATAGVDNDATYTEQAPILTLAADLVLSDDGATLTGATIQVTGGFVPLAGDGADYLGIAGSGSGTIGGISYAYSALTGILTLSGSASVADYQAVLRQVSFQSTSNDPGTSRTISWTVSDGELQSDPVETTIAVTPVNDAPAGGDETVTMEEDGTYVFAAADFNFSDPLDGNLLAGVVITTLPATGTLYLNEVAVTAGDFITVADIDANLLTYQPAADEFGDGYATFTFQVRDDGGIANGGVDTDQSANTMTIDVTQDIAASAQDDAFATDEATAIVGGDLFADNGSGADSDPDDPLVIAEVNGSGANVGTEITLTSGALLTVNSDGTFDYDPNGVFDDLAGPDSGASNTSASDSFTYALADGNTATVTITVNGIDGVDVLVGTEGDDTLYAGAGDDSVQGLGGDDTIYGGSGADSMAGGTGNDIYFVDNAGDVVTEVADEGIDQVVAFIDHVLADNVENLWLGAGAVSGTGNSLDNVITGNSAANNLAGGGGNDTLNGGAGADTMAGGTGDDVYVVDNAGDVVTEAPDEGTDRVVALIDYTLAANVENLWLGAGAVSGTGNGLDNVIVGNVAANSLAGGGGNDTLNGLAGADSMAGGTGNDTYVVDNAGDVVTEGVSAGTDQVIAFIDHVLADNVETLWLGAGAVSGTGNGLDNVINGNIAANTLAGGGGNDILNGLAGADTMAGGTGNDVYVVDNAGDVVTEVADEGTDRVSSFIDYVLGANVEDLWLAAGAISGTGNDLDNVIAGNIAANNLSGEGGDDKLYGNAGNDILTGGAGADGFYFHTALDAVSNVDSILDFSAADDSIHLDLAVFTELAGAGALDAAAFRAGTAATDADDRIIYDQATGNLYYDADGDGAAAAVQFAQLTPTTALTEADFFAY